MHIRRQLTAAGLYVVVVLAAPGAAWRAAAPVQASAPFLHVSDRASGAALPVYLPLLARPALAPVDVSVQTVEVVQGVRMSDAYTVRIAGRSALVRVFVTVTGTASPDGISARLTHYIAGAPHGALAAGPLALATGATEAGDFEHTFNFNLPAEWATADSAYVIELDHINTILETNEANNRYPAAGEQAYNFVDLAALEVVIVPVTYARPGATTTTPPLDDLSYLTWMPEKVLPVAHVKYTVRPAPLVFAGDLRTANGWGELLVAVDAIRAAEDPTWNKAYYGLVDTAGAESCLGGCYTGLGYVNSPDRTVYKTAVGFAGFPGNRGAASATFAHELGHNFGRRHAPCAGPSNVDPAYPYTSAAIGQWGYDVQTGDIKPPSHKDYMSYCGPEWTSDYTYHGIAQSWDWLNKPITGAAASGASDSLVVTGYLASDGRLRVEPVFRGYAPPQVFSGAPSHRLELVDATGWVLSTAAFEMAELALDRGGESEQAGDEGAPGLSDQLASFRVSMAPVPGLAGFRIYDGETLVYERFAAGDAPRLAEPTGWPLGNADPGLVRWALAAGASNVRYRVRFSPNGGASWTLLALASPTCSIEVAANLLVGAKLPVLEVQASDGVRTDRQTLALDWPSK